MSVILSETTDGVLTITLNRPKSYNAFTRELALKFQDELDRADKDDSIRAIVITGAGKAFCSGQDIKELQGPKAIPLARILKEHYNPIARKIRTCRKPVIAAVNGVAAGAGANIAIACDIVLASTQASFVQAFSKIGLIPDSGGTWTLPRIVGLQKASELMMTGDKLTVQRAAELGMIAELYDSDNFMDDVMNYAKKIAQMPTVSLASIKELLNKSATNTFEEQLELEDHFQRKCSETQDYKEGIEAFLQKRAPKFIGK